MPSRAAGPAKVEPKADAAKRTVWVVGADQRDQIQIFKWLRACGEIEHVWLPSHLGLENALKVRFWNISDAQKALHVPVVKLPHGYVSVLQSSASEVSEIPTASKLASTKARLRYKRSFPTHIPEQEPAHDWLRLQLRLTRHMQEVASRVKAVAHSVLEEVRTSMPQPPDEIEIMANYQRAMIATYDNSRRDGPPAQTKKRRRTNRMAAF